MGLFGLGKKKSSKARDNKRREDKISEERKNLLTPRSDFFVREAYKALRTNVSFALEGEENCKVIVVTSSLQGEGKSITAMNLAISYAMTDRKVLVIDCDLRRPKVARLMQMSAKYGLSNVIVNPDLLDQAILPTSVKGLNIMLSGDIPPNPSELLSSAKMQSLLGKLREMYDFIILDSPPINMVIDAVVLAPESDGVLFLVRANRAERGSVIHAVEQLEYAKIKILGFVLNDVDMEKTHYGYGKYRYKSYKRYGRGYSGYYGYGRRGYGYGYRSPYGYGYGKIPRENVEPEEQMEREEP